MTKVDIFSGFLGAGKTTLIKKLIKEAYCGEKLVIIENEFGKIGIDGGFLRESGIEITEMNSGCICCSLVGDFGKSLHEVMDKFSPDRIVIEPSGVGKLSDVIKAVTDAGIDEMVLNAFVTVIDASKCKMYMRNFEEFYRNQIEFASTVILSRTSGISEEKLSEAVKTVRDINKTASVITTPWEELDGKAMLEAIEKRNTLDAELKQLLDEQTKKPHHGRHHHGECDDPDCECHHHDEEHEHHHGHHHEHHHDGECCDHDHDCRCHGEHEHHHGECDDSECKCHHHDEEHEHHEHHHEHHHGECDDPDCECHHHGEGHEHHHEHGHHHADDVFTSWGIETTDVFTTEFIESCLTSLDSGDYGTILRAKGIVRGADGKWINFDYVPDEHNVRCGAADMIGKLCVIGAKLDKEALCKLFDPKN